MTTTIGQHMQLQVCATGEETCNTGNELDWALVSKHLAADLTGKVSWMVPFKTHALIQYNLAGHYEAIAVQQLTKFGPAPKLVNPEKTWHQTEPQEVQVQWLQQHTDPLTKQMGSMYQRIERYVLQQLEQPTMGRGLKLQYVNRPLHDASKPWIWKRGSLAFGTKWKSGYSNCCCNKTENLDIRHSYRNWAGSWKTIGIQMLLSHVKDSDCFLRCFGVSMMKSTFMFC